MSETEVHPIPTPIAFLYVLSGAILVGTLFVAVWEYTGLAGVLALSEVSVVVGFLCRESIVGDVL